MTGWREKAGVAAKAVENRGRRLVTRAGEVHRKAPKPRARHWYATTRWLGRNYWIVMIGVGALLGSIAIWFYLLEIAVAVRSIVDRLAAAATGTGNSAELRNLAQSVAWLLGGLAASTTLLFQLVKVWTTERAISTAEQGHITDRINSAVLGLGAEEDVNQLGRNVSYTLKGEAKSDFEWKDKTLELPSEAVSVAFGEWKNVALTVPNIEVRTGAIYSLERISQDSRRDHVQVMEILTSYIRQNAPASSAKKYPHPAHEPLSRESNALERQERLDQWADRFGTRKSKPWARTWFDASLTLRLDIQVALEVISRRRPERREYETSIGYSPDLRKVNFQGMLLSGIRLQGINLKGSFFDGADGNATRVPMSDDFENYLDLRDCNLEDVSFIGATLRCAKFDGSVIVNSRFEGAELEYASFEGCKIDRSDFAGSQAHRADFSKSEISQCNLECFYADTAKFHASVIYQSNLQGANFVDAKFQEAHCKFCDLSHGSLCSSEIINARFTGCLMLGVNFYGAFTDDQTSFENCDLSYSTVSNTDLRGAPNVVPALVLGDENTKLAQDFSLKDTALSHWQNSRTGRVTGDTWHAWQRKIGFLPPEDAP